MDFTFQQTVPTAAVAGLLVAFAIKQALADYMLQTAAMVHGKEAKSHWLWPLSVHVGIHAAGTLLLALAVNPVFWWLAAVDFVAHGAIDRVKSIIGGYGRWHPSEGRFWWLHGIDQAAHHLVHFAFVLILAGALTPG